MEQSSYKLGGATTADVFIAIDPNADPTAKLTIFSPIGYSANLTAAPGTKIGAVVARVKAKAVAGALLTLAGDVLVANPADPAIQAASTQCRTPRPTRRSGSWHEPAGPEGHRSRSSSTRSARSSPSRSACPRRTFLPEMAARLFGAQLFAADFTIKNVFTNAGATGGYEWAGISRRTPPAHRRRTRSGTLEARTYVGLPSSLTLKRATAKRGSSSSASSRSPASTRAGIKLDLYSGKKAAPAPNAVSGGTGKRIARSPAAPGQRQLLDRPAEREVRDLLPDEVRELHDGVHRAFALRPTGSVSRRAHRRDHEQPGQGPSSRRRSTSSPFA